ncbi:MAG: hypothetical protein ACKVH7_11030 [Alphaproteobacteria bacterium]
MTLLLFKLFATPAIIAMAGWASARWGAAAGGWMAGLPMTTGPISVFLAIEYGPAFASQAALGTLLAMPAIAGFAIGYLQTARRGHSWLACAVVSQLSYVLIMALVVPFQIPMWFVFCLSALSLGGGLAMVGLRNRPVLVSLSTRSVLVLRMIVTTTLVMIITLVAPHLGPLLSGMLSTVLIVAGVLAAASHRQHGAAGGTAVIRGMMMGQISFLGFLTVVWALLPTLGLVTYLAAIAVAVILGMVASRAVTRLLPSS